MLTVEEIKDFMATHSASVWSRKARIGQRYYDGKHDIRDTRIIYVNNDGNIREDPWKSNIRISHPFFTEIVDQGTQYELSGKDGFVRSDDDDLQKELDKYFNDNEDFTSELYETLNGSQVKGCEYMYAYKGEDNRTTFVSADSLSVVEVKARDASDGEDHIIYWYDDTCVLDKQPITRIQVWDAQQVFYYSQDGQGEITTEKRADGNPRPHTLYQKGKGGRLMQESYDKIPFFPLPNNSKRVSSLETIKDLIDDYDLMSCGLSNNIQDTAEVIYAVTGFEGNDLDALRLNINAKRTMGIPEGGSFEAKMIDVPYEARQAKLDMDEKNIFRFGYGLNTYGLRDTASTTNIAIKSAYSLLDLKANKMEIRLKQFMRKLLDIVLAEINKASGTDYQQKDVYFVFDREVPTNALENAQIEQTEAATRQLEINTILNTPDNLMDEDTRIELLAEQYDIDVQQLKDRINAMDEADGLYAAETALAGLDGGGGGLIE